jgi:hypothetical protein
MDDRNTALPRGRLWTVDEVAWYLGVTPETLRQQRREGRPPGVLGFLVGERGPIRYRPTDVDAWLDVQRGTSRTVADVETAEIMETLTPREQEKLIEGLVADEAETEAARAAEHTDDKSAGEATR